MKNKFILSLGILTIGISVTGTTIPHLLIVQMNQLL